MVAVAVAVAARVEVQVLGQHCRRRISKWRRTFGRCETESTRVVEWLHVCHYARKMPSATCCKYRARAARPSFPPLSLPSIHPSSPIHPARAPASSRFPTRHIFFVVPTAMNVSVFSLRVLRPTSDSIHLSDSPGSRCRSSGCGSWSAIRLIRKFT